MRPMVAERIQTFSVGYRESAYSELSWARTVAQRLDTDHHEITVGREDFFDALPRLVWHLEEPRVGQSYPNFYISQLASKFCKVVLAGTGGEPPATSGATKPGVP